MSRGRRDLDYMMDIEDAITRILNYTRGLSWDEYLKDIRTQDAVIRNLEVIGEASKKISDSVRIEHPEIPWREISGTRDRLTHHYFGINQEIIWQIVAQDLPALKEKVAQVIRKISLNS